jgi:hypothetical protein
MGNSPASPMDSFWAKTYGCQAEDCYELLRAPLQDRKEILGAEAARYLGFDLEVIQPLLQRLVEEGVAVATGQGAACFYRWHEASRAGK